jgi:hypothetical protein
VVKNPEMFWDVKEKPCLIGAFSGLQRGAFDSIGFRPGMNLVCRTSDAWQA